MVVLHNMFRDLESASEAANHMMQSCRDRTATELIYKGTGGSMGSRHVIELAMRVVFSDSMARSKAVYWQVWSCTPWLQSP
jgi:hypothetical protein